MQSFCNKFFYCKSYLIFLNRFKMVVLFLYHMEMKEIAFISGDRSLIWTQDYACIAKVDLSLSNKLSYEAENFYCSFNIFTNDFQLVILFSFLMEIKESAFLSTPKQLRQPCIGPCFIRVDFLLFFLTFSLRYQQRKHGQH